MCARVCVRACLASVCICVLVPVSKYGGQSITNFCIYVISFSLCLRQSLFNALKAGKLLETLLSLPSISCSHVGIHRLVLLHPAFIWILKIQIQVSGLCGKYFTSKESLQSPSIF